MKYIQLTTAAVVLLLLCGCDAVDSQILQTTRAYWPKVELFHPRRDIVLLETHMSGITAKFAAETFKAVLDEHGKDLRMGFQVSGYTVLILGFDGYHVVWSLPQERFVVLNQDLYVPFYENAFHALPTEMR